MANWRESVQISLESRKTNTTEPVVKDSDSINKTEKKTVQNSGDWHENVLKSLESRGYTFTSEYTAPETQPKNDKKDSTDNAVPSNSGEKRKAEMPFGIDNTSKTDNSVQGKISLTSEKNTGEKATESKKTLSGGSSFGGDIDSEGKRNYEYKAPASNAEFVKNQKKAEKIFEKYDIDPDNFANKDLMQWATKHGFKLDITANGSTWRDYNATKQEKEDFEVLKALSANNARKEMSQTAYSDADAYAIRHAGHALDLADNISKAFGASSDAGINSKYKAAGLDPEKYISPQQAVYRSLNETEKRRAKEYYEKNKDVNYDDSFASNEGKLLVPAIIEGVKNATEKEGLSLNAVGEGLNNASDNWWFNRVFSELGARIKGNVKVGRTNIKSNTAGYYAYRGETDDIEAAETYQKLANEIQEHNRETFNNDNLVKETVATIAQYIPQGVDQMKYRIVGQAVGAAIGAAVGGQFSRIVGGSYTTAKYMYEQTAGAAFVETLQTSDLSVEDAKKLAASEGTASGLVEFGLEAAIEAMWWGIGKVSLPKSEAKTIGGALKRASEAATEKATSKLIASGISEKGAKIIVSAAKNAAKRTLNALGEGTEEFIQEGISIVREKAAADGTPPEDLAWYKLLLKSFDLTQYTKEDLERMLKAGVGGFVIGWFAGGVESAKVYGRNKVAGAIDSAIESHQKNNAMTSTIKDIDAKSLGEGIINFDNPDIITDAVELARDNASPEVAQAVEAIDNAVADDETPPAEAVGTVVKSVLFDNQAAEQEEPTVENAENVSAASEAKKETELDEIMSSGEIEKYTPESASSDIKKLENMLIAQGADDSSRSEIVSAAVEAENALSGSDVSIKSVLNEAAQAASAAISEIRKQTGASGAYWNLFGENVKAVTSDNNTELITAYANAYADALKKGNPEKYNSVFVDENGKDVSSELTRTITENVIPYDLKNAGEYKLTANKIKEIAGNAIQKISAVKPATQNVSSVKAASAEQPMRNIVLTRTGDFYEAYGMDARDLSEKYGYTITNTDVSGAEVDMVKFPVSSLETVVNNLPENYGIEIRETTTAEEADRIIKAQKPRKSSVKNQAKETAPLSKSEMRIFTGGKGGNCVYTMVHGEGFLVDQIGGMAIYFPDVAAIEEYCKENDVKLNKIINKNGVEIPGVKDLDNATLITDAGDYIPAKLKTKADKLRVYALSDFDENGFAVGAVFADKYVKILEKHSDRMIIKAGKNANYIIGYTADGEMAGFALSILAKPNVPILTDDGKSSNSKALYIKASPEDLKAATEGKTKNADSVTEAAKTVQEENARESKQEDTVSVEKASEQIETKLFREIVDEVSSNSSTDGKKGKYYFVSKNTPEIIVNKAKIENLPMIISFETLYLAVRDSGEIEGHYHNLGPKNVKNIYQVLSNPMYILKNNNTGRINIISDIATENKKSVVSIELDVYKNVENNDVVNHSGNYNLIITLFDAKKSYVNNLKNQKDVTVIYEKKEDTSGSDLTAEISAARFTKEIPSSNNRISQNNGIVNSSDENNTGVTKKKAGKGVSTEFKQNEIKVLCDAPAHYYDSIDGTNYFVNGYMAIECSQEEADKFNKYLEKKYKNKEPEKAKITEMSDTVKRSVILRMSGKSEIADAGNPLVSSSSSNEYVYVINGKGISYNKEYADIISKRSKYMKILSDGKYGNTILAGFSDDGKIVGFALPIYWAGSINYVSLDGTGENLKGIKQISDRALAQLVKDAERKAEELYPVPENLPLTEETSEEPEAAIPETVEEPMPETNAAEASAVEAAPEVSENQAESDSAYVDEYTKTLSTLRGAKAKELLNRKVRSEYGIVTRAEFIRKRLEEGNELLEDRYVKNSVLNMLDDYRAEESYNRNRGAYNARGMNAFDVAKEYRELLETKQGGDRIKSVDPLLAYKVLKDESILPAEYFDTVYHITDNSIKNDNVYTRIFKTDYDYGKWLEKELEKKDANNEKVLKNTAESGIIDAEEPDVKYSLSGRGNGYYGYSMSNNAIDAYESGEKPISKWTKSDIIEAVKEINPEAAELIERVNLKTLKDNLLTRTSWHHTSKMYNATDFYSIDEDAVENLTAEKVNSWAAHTDTKAVGREFRGDIHYLEWSGTRKHPKATERVLNDVNIEERGSFYIVTDDDGKEILRKKIGSNGTSVVDYEAEARKASEREATRAEMLDRVRSNSSAEAYALYEKFLNDGYERSTSGNLYARGGKPSPADVEGGLENFFRKGEQRLVPNGDGYALETWDGSKWKEDDYDYTKPFSEQIDDYKARKIPKNDTFIVSGTPKIWQGVGFNALPVTIDQKHVDYALNGTKDADHYLGEENLKKLPEAIKEPIAIIQSRTVPSRAVVILSMENNGKKVIVPFEVDGYGKINNESINSNAISSVYGKGNILEQLRDAIANTVNGKIELFYWNKKEAKSLLHRAGLQLPGVLPQDGFVHSIREKGSNVKIKLENVTQSLQFKRWSGDNEVVNEDGTPKYLYHQTEKDFTEFDVGHPGAGYYDNELPDGIYMKETPDTLKLGKTYENSHQMPLFSSMQNPLRFETREDASRFWQKNVPGYSDLKNELDEVNKKYRAEEDEINKELYTAEEDENGVDPWEVATDNLFERWTAEENKISRKMKAAINSWLADSKYDGIILEKDKGTGGTVKTWIALSPTQVKSVDNIGTYGVNTRNIYYAVESEDNYGRDDLLPGNSGRERNARAGEQAERISSYKRSLEGKTRAERESTAKTLLKQGKTKEVTDGEHRYNLISPEDYNDDMRSVVENAKSKGRNVRFFAGAAVRMFDGRRDFKIDGIRAGNNNILLRYDGYYTPQTLLAHESVHDDWNTPAMQNAKEIILGDLTDAEKKELLSEGRYKEYMNLYHNNEDAVWEEFVADVFAGMNDYSDDFIDVVTSYTYDGEVIDTYSPAEYNKIMDAGGANEAVLDNIGIAETIPDLRYSTKYYWHPDLPKEQIISLQKTVRNDIKASTNSITDTANWLTTHINGEKVFAIYSTEDELDPTILYEKRGEQGEFEKLITINIAEDVKNGKSFDGKPDTIDQIFRSSWLRVSGGNVDDTGTLGRKGNNRNVGVLQGPPERTPSRAFRSVIKNLLEVQERRGRGITEDDDVKYSLTPIEDDEKKLTPERRKEIEEQFNKDRAEIIKPTKKQLWGERAAWVAHNITRVFPDIPERGAKGTFFAEFRKDMIQWKNLPSTASFMVQDKLNQMTKDLTPKEFRTFSELVYFLDLQEEAKLQKERGYTEILLPNNIQPAEVDELVTVLNEEATDNVKKALDKRKKIWSDLKSQYIELNRNIGFETEDKFKRDNYYHHQVIDYMNEGGKGTGSREISVKAGRGWLKERQGSTKAINTDFLYVENQAMLQMQYDTYIAETLGKIKQQYDIKPQLERQAFKSNKQALNEIIKKEATENGKLKLDSKGRPDSDTYRRQQWFNQRIMFGFSGLFELAKNNALPTYNGEFSDVIDAFKVGSLDAPGLYRYVSVLASIDSTDEALEQAAISARTVLKYTSQKNAWVKSVLGNNYETWETLARSMKGTYTIHQPRRGNYFYTKTIIDEDAFNSAFNDMVLKLSSGEVKFGDTDINKLFTEYADTVRLTGAAYEQWVLPNEIVSTMNEIANPKQSSEMAKVVRGIVSSWKGWATSVNPLRTVKFGIRNMVGDLDAVIAGKPQVVAYSKKAVQDIYQAMKHKNYTPEFLEWVERGGYTSMLFANEMDTEMQDKLFEHLKEKEGKSIFSIPAKLIEKYYDGVENAHNFREAILRYSAYLYFKDEITKNNGTVKDYVASNKYIVRGLNTTEDKAYQLSKDLLGAYDEVGKMGQSLRRYWVPFYSFTETNLKRYYRMFENIITSNDNIPKKAGKLLLKALMANALVLLMTAWNRLVKKDDDDELPPSVRNIPHLTLGKIGENVYAFRQLGSFSELLEWAGLDDYKWTKEDLTAPLDKAWGMITPFVKLPVELASGLNFYPSLTQPRAIRDKWQHFFDSWGVGEVYDNVTGKPTRGVSNILKSAFIYSYDSKESAYYEIQDLKRSFQGNETGNIYGPTAKSNALYYMKTAIRYKDKKAAYKYLDEYFKNGGTVKGIKQSISTLNPMYGFTGKETAAKGAEFIASLTDEQKDKLRIAQDYYENDLMLPENVLAILGQKGITDEQAKQALRNYIDAKCKK